MRHVFGGFPALTLIPSRDMSTATWPFWAARWLPEKPRFQRSMSAHRLLMASFVIFAMTCPRPFHRPGSPQVCRGNWRFGGSESGGGLTPVTAKAAK